MCNSEIIKIIKEIQSNDMSRFGELYDVFSVLIRHFDYKSDFEDASSELSLFLLELIYSLDTDKFISDGSEALKRYIAVSLRNRYIALSKRKAARRCEIACLEENTASTVLNQDERLALKEGLRLLSAQQRKAIVLRHIYGFSDAEIADRLGITRQAVNRLGSRGLKTLRQYFGIL